MYQYFVKTIVMYIYVFGLVLLSPVYLLAVITLLLLDMS